MNLELNQILMQNGYLELEIPWIYEVFELVKNEHYRELDEFFSKEIKSSGRLYQLLQDIFEFKDLEHIIAVRSAPEDEDGIWHDDGSRLIGFSLSLNLEPHEIEGGNLLFRLKNDSKLHVFTPRPMGTLIVFLTGQFHYEHKVTQVTKGKRTVIAGWGSASPQ